MILDILQEDIDLGKRGDPGCCVVARSAMRAGIMDPEVDGHHVRTKKIWYKLPSNGKELVEDFDDGRYVKPCQLELVPV